MLCNGGEKGIEFCKSRGWGNSDCTHDEDAGVVCKDERIPGFVDSNVIDVSCHVTFHHIMYPVKIKLLCLTLLLHNL